MVISLIVGVVLGFLSGLGIGGGSLLILWLTMVMHLDQTAARSINLLFFIPSALTAGYFRWKQGSIDLKKLLPAILGGCASALGFSLLGTRLDTGLLKRLFGVLLIATGLREIFYKPKTKGEGQ